MSASRDRQPVNVLEEDPDLGQTLDPATFERVRRKATVRSVTVSPGVWHPLDVAVDSVELFALLVIDGLLVRRVDVGGRDSVDLLRPGDLILPLDGALAGLGPPVTQVSWRVMTRLRLAVLDERFQVAITGLAPEVMRALIDRVLRRYAVITQRLSIVKERRLDAKLHMVLWQFAEDSGTVEGDRVVLRLPLSHEQLGDLVSAQREPISRALKRLDDAALVSPTEGGWILWGRQPQSFDEAGVAGSAAV